MTSAKWWGKWWLLEVFRGILVPVSVPMLIRAQCDPGLCQVWLVGVGLSESMIGESGLHTLRIIGLKLLCAG